MVRPGLLAFGIYPSVHYQKPAGLQPILSLRAKISYFKVVAQNQGISYGHTYKTAKQSRIVTIPIGYGDGYRRSLSNCGPILIRGKRYSIAGTICMDQCMVDIGNNEAYVGDTVTLLGSDGNQEITVYELAELCKTIPYEILCSLHNTRQPRLYHTRYGTEVWDFA
jgi:alanine racemase